MRFNCGPADGVFFVLPALFYVRRYRHSLTAAWLFWEAEWSWPH